MSFEGVLCVCGHGRIHHFPDDGMVPPAVPCQALEHDAAGLEHDCGCRDFTLAPAMPTLPALFDCGCSHLKVRAGLCDIFGPDGKERRA